MSQSSTSSIWMRVLVLACIVVCIAFSVRATGEDKKTGAFATVDFKKIASEYKAKDAVESTIKAMQTKYDARLNRRDNMPLLSEEEQQTLDTLSEKPMQTDADKAKIKEIEDKAKRLSDEVQALGQKSEKDLTD